MSILTDARAEWTAREEARLYFAPNASLLDARYSLHLQRGRLLDLADAIAAAGSTEAGVEAFRQSHSFPADANEIASALALLA